MARVLIADGHASTRQSVRDALGALVEFCGSAATDAQTMTCVETLAPDVVLLDVDLPGRPTVELVGEIRRLYPLKVIVLSTYESPALAWLFRKSGADGYLVKSDIGSVLAEAVLRVLQGRPYFAERMIDGAIEHLSEMPSPAPSELTEREREVLRLLALGGSNKDVAAELRVSVNTVETHRARIMNKLNRHTITALVVYAIRSRLIDI